MRRRLLCLGFASAALLLPAGAAQGATLPSGFQESTAFSGLTNPMAVEFASDGRVFVAEKSGLIKVFDNLSDTTPTTFADLRTNVHNFWDRGMLGLALAPELPRRSRTSTCSTRTTRRSAAPAPRWGTAGGDLRRLPDPARADRRRLRRQRPALAPDRPPATR